MLRFGKNARPAEDFKTRSQLIRSLVYELSAFKNREINEVRIEKGFGDFLIKLESSKFRSNNPNVGVFKLHVSPEEFWSRPGSSNHAALKDKIVDALREL